jgi:hypothetical protein
MAQPGRLDLNDGIAAARHRHLRKLEWLALFVKLSCPAFPGQGIPG